SEEESEAERRRRESLSFSELISTKIRLWEERHALDDQEMEKEEDERGENVDGWALLPDIVLEKIFSYLSIEKKYYASVTCRNWYRAFHLPRVWWDFVMNDTTLTRCRFDYGEKCWRHVLEHHRTQEMIRNIGNRIRSLSLHPTSFAGLFAHFHFMNHLSSYAERYLNDPTSPNACQFNVESFRFSFFCDIKTRDEHFIYGTGGEILGCLKRLIGKLTKLRSLRLFDLLLDEAEALNLLDDACMTLCERLTHLALINASKYPLELLHPAAFVNLVKLYISPQNLGDELVQVLSAGSLEEMHIVQNSYTETAVAVSAKCWMLASFKVYLRTWSNVHRDIVWQEKAPCVSVIYDSPMTKPSQDAMLTITDLYPGLTEFGYLTIPRFRSSRKFVNRIDAPLLRFCRRCPYLTTLYVRDRISTSTALLIASMSPNLKYFIVRRNAWLKKRDYMFHDDLHLDYNFREWIKINCDSYEKTSREISKILGISWRPMSDKEFKILCQQRPAY
ncbi:F-box/LRR-repeat protein 3, partial [Orchesella cincta]